MLLRMATHVLLGYPRLRVTTSSKPKAGKGAASNRSIAPTSAGAGLDAPQEPVAPDARSSAPRGLVLPAGLGCPMLVCCTVKHRINYIFSKGVCVWVA